VNPVTRAKIRHNRRPFSGKETQGQANGSTMRRTLLFLLVMLSLSMTVASAPTASASGALEPGHASDAPWTVLVIDLGWHAGIAVRADEIEPGLIPEVGDFVNATWIEFGWGDRAFYQDPDPDISAYLSAAFHDTPAVMHLVAMGVHPRRYFGSTVDVLEVPLTVEEHRRLVAHISRSFERGSAGRAAPIGNGLYGASLFYDADGVFNLSNTCNTWIAHGLKEAGLDIDTRLRRSSTLMQRLRAALKSR
jgi:uncharacterized protein (TIGR02117 family)